MTKQDAPLVDVAKLRKLYADWQQPDSDTSVGFALRSEAVNALPALLTAYEATAAKDAEIRALREALEPFADACRHLHPSQPDDGETLDGFTVSDFRRARAALTKDQSHEQ